MRVLALYDHLLSDHSCGDTCVKQHPLRLSQPTPFHLSHTYMGPLRALKPFEPPWKINRTSWCPWLFISNLKQFVPHRPVHMTLKVPKAYPRVLKWADGGNLPAAAMCDPWGSMWNRLERRVCGQIGTIDEGPAVQAPLWILKDKYS